MHCSRATRICTAAAVRGNGHWAISNTGRTAQTTVIFDVSFRRWWRKPAPIDGLQRGGTIFRMLRARRFYRGERSLGAPIVILATTKRAYASSGKRESHRRRGCVSRLRSRTRPPSSRRQRASCGCSDRSRLYFTSEHTVGHAGDLQEVNGVQTCICAVSHCWPRINLQSERAAQWDDSSWSQIALQFREMPRRAVWRSASLRHFAKAVCGSAGVATRATRLASMTYESETGSDSSRLICRGPNFPRV
jgi:hypothetical protein